MKKLNSKGFTLIELLAVITIMGILMLVAIPAVSRTIENSRRDTFMDTAKSYINAVKNAVASESIDCPNADGDLKPIAALTTGDYEYYFKSGDVTATDLLEQGGKSSWSNAEVDGYIVIHKEVKDDSSTYTYSITMVDEGDHGIKDLTPENNLKRAKVLTKGAGVAATDPGYGRCELNY